MTSIHLKKRHLIPGTNNPRIKADTILNQENTIEKLTHEEVRIAGQAAKDAYHNEGYDVGRKIVDELESRMLLSGNNFSEDNQIFQDPTSFSWRS